MASGMFLIYTCDQPLGEWKRATKSNRRGVCLDCARRHRQNPVELKRCTGKCAEELPEISFSQYQWKRVSLLKIKCKKCCKAMKNSDTIDEKQCQVCEKMLSHIDFTDREWRGHNGKHKCRSCVIGPRAREGEWTCRKCKTSFSKEFFRMWMVAKNTDKSKNAKCNTCWMQECVQEMTTAASNMEHVMKTGK